VKICSSTAVRVAEEFGLGERPGIYVFFPLCSPLSCHAIVCRKNELELAFETNAEAAHAYLHMLHPNDHGGGARWASPWSQDLESKWHAV
jgi:hypothetical protein